MKGMDVLQTARCLEQRIVDKKAWDVFITGKSMIENMTPNFLLGFIIIMEYLNYLQDKSQFIFASASPAALHVTTSNPESTMTAQAGLGLIGRNLFEMNGCARAAGRFGVIFCRSRLLAEIPG